MSQRESSRDECKEDRGGKCRGPGTRRVPCKDDEKVFSEMVDVLLSRPLSNILSKVLINCTGGFRYSKKTGLVFLFLGTLGVSCPLSRTSYSSTWIQTRDWHKTSLGVVRLVVRLNKKSK